MIVWLASYPRSGNTFLRIMLYHSFGLQTYSLHGDVRDIAAHRPTSEIVGHAALPSGWTPDRARTDDQLWLVKTHDRPRDEGKAIYVIRDGRETVVSYFNHLQHYADCAPSLLLVLAGAVPFGPWSHHVEAWDPLHRSDTLLLRFEDLVRHPQKHLPHLARFLDMKPLSQSTPDFAELHATDPNFFRSGRTDSWKTVFDEDHHYLFWLLHRDVMVKYGYTDGMPEVFGAGPSDTRDESVGAANQESEMLRRMAETPVRRLSEEHRRRLCQVEAQKRNLDRELAAIRSSNSWRLTSPLRKASAVLRRLKH